MTPATRFLSVTPIGETDPLDMPVADAARTAEFYRDRRGFRTLELEPTAAMVARDDVTLRLAQNGGDPEQASCYIAVSDIDAVQREYHAQGVCGDVAEMEHDGAMYRVIWVRDPDGLCYCLGQPKAAE
jgi:catechol 2,3-dioxygenase-like lactoylglutathione lyase family enzyme